MEAVVAVVGPGDPAAAGDLRDQVAYDVGAGIARLGAVLVCGGLGGVMAAACRGAAEAGGRTLGLLPGSDLADANPWVTLAVPTGLGEGRNALVVRSADVVVAIGGSWGTLSEVALALRAGTPVVGVRTWTVLGSDGEPVDAAVVRAEDAPAALQAVAGWLRRTP